MATSPNPNPSTSSLPFCMEKARKLAKKLGLDYYDNPDHLTLTEAIHLLLPQAKLGEGFPAEEEKQEEEEEGSSSCPPWRLDGDDQDEQVINNLLHHSMRVQMGTVPDTEFSKCILSNEPLATNGLVRLYLSQLGVDCDLTCGVLTFSDAASSDGTPYAWLDMVDDKIIDNVFVHLPPEKVSKNMFLRLKHKSLYAREDPCETERKMYFGGQNVSDNTLKLYKHYGNAKNIEKYLLTCFKLVSVVPGVKMYDVLMRDYLQRVHGKPVPDLEGKWESRCWECLKEDKSALKACSVCKFARYCSQKCQKKDWKVHKILHEEMVSRCT